MRRQPSGVSSPTVPLHKVFIISQSVGLASPLKSVGLWCEVVRSAITLRPLFLSGTTTQRAARRSRWWREKLQTEGEKEKRFVGRVRVCASVPRAWAEISCLVCLLQAVVLSSIEVKAPSVSSSLNLLTSDCKRRQVTVASFRPAQAEATILLLNWSFNLFLKQKMLWFFRGFFF